MLPDRFLEQDTQEGQYRTAGLDVAGIVSAALTALGIDSKVAKARA